MTQLELASGQLVARGSAPSPSSGGRPGAAWFVALGGYLLVYISWQLFHWLPFDDVVAHVIEKPINATAALVAWQASGRVRASHRTALAWRLMALGLVGQFAGGLAVDVYTLLGKSPYPSLADPLYLSFYPLMLAALLVLPRARQTRSQHVRLALDLTTTALGVATVVWYVLIEPTARAGGQNTLQMTFSLAYPVGDMILLVGVASLLLRGVAEAMRTALWLVTVGLGLFVVGDVLYAYVTLHGVFQNGDALDITYAVAFSLFVLAARCQGSLTATAAARTGPVRSQGVSWVPYLAVAAGFSVLVVSEVTEGSRALIVAIAATALAILVSARQLVAQRELVALQRQLRTQATTDALTGLGNRRQLLNDLQRHFDPGSGERPALLTVFDLNGFKNYNDTFGHPAGDALLTRLGSALADAVAPFGGRAYRPGGDEFCVIADANRPDALEQAASLALSESGPGFAISTAFGTVATTGSAGDAAEAMRQADTAMYVQKRSGRATAGRQSTDVLMRALAERHPDLGDHLNGVAELVVEVAQRLDIAGDELVQLRQAATLHNVGKVAIPDTIMSKPGALDDEEAAFMRRHTLIGERIIAAAPALGHAARLVRSSNESFDGSGYPDGLAGDEIPLGARIIATCNAFDVMISTRPNSPARSTGEALAELHRCAGTQFDPAIVATFEQIMAERALLPTATPA
jgi:two-component system cell cycle response regulator